MATSVKEIIQSLAPQQINFIAGRVSSVQPLIVVSVANEKLILDEDNLLIPEHLQDRDVTVEIGGKKQTIKMYEGLKEQDVLIILHAVSLGLFIVIGREKENGV